MIWYKVFLAVENITVEALSMFPVPASKSLLSGKLHDKHIKGGGLCIMLYINVCTLWL